jgi:predicted RNase H-like nuclease (RuvC/YqgF family)
MPERFEDKLRGRLDISEDTLRPSWITISRDERDALADAVEALRELKENYEETDAFPTSDGHPLYKARAALAELDGPDG